MYIDLHNTTSSLTCPDAHEVASNCWNAREKKNVGGDNDSNKGREVEYSNTKVNRSVAMLTNFCYPIPVVDTIGLR